MYFNFKSQNSKISCNVHWIGFTDIFNYSAPLMTLPKTFYQNVLKIKFLITRLVLRAFSNNYGNKSYATLCRLAGNRRDLAVDLFLFEKIQKSQWRKSYSAFLNLSTMCPSTHARSKCIGMRVDKMEKLSRMFSKRHMRWCFILWKLKLIAIAYHLTHSSGVQSLSTYEIEQTNCIQGPYLIYPELQHKYCLAIILCKFQRFFLFNTGRSDVGELFPVHLYNHSVAR